MVELELDTSALEAIEKALERLKKDRVRRIYRDASKRAITTARKVGIKALGKIYVFKGVSVLKASIPINKLNDGAEMRIKGGYTSAQKYFKKYNKLKNAGQEIAKQMTINVEEKEYLENTLLSIENCDDAKELKEIREELIREGYIKSYKMPKKDNKPGTDMRKYISCEGNMIIVGKNNKQNDYLTLRLADNEDYWFHTKDIPGSHVLIKSAGKKVTDKELLEAAILAAYYSKARMSANVPVDYTMKKNVKKPSGAKPGMVIYEKNKTLYVTPSDEAKAKIKKS